MLKLLSILGAVVAMAAPAPPPRAVLLLSIDGLRPDYVTGAEHAGLKLPNLRRLVREGTSASAVRGVLPTVTYPSHTSLITGVTPSRHGIGQNKPFDPSQKNPDAWYWYAEDIRVPTLWDAAAGVGYVVGSVSWPVSVGARSIRCNLPEYAGTRSAEDLKMVRALAGPGWFDGLQKAAGPYLVDVGEGVARDWSRTRYAVEMIRRDHTRFLTVHLAALDHAQHETGPFSRHAVEAIEAIDRMVGELWTALLGEDPAGAFCVVSDHGFAPVEHLLKLDAAFVKAGLMATEGGWKAMPWSAGGSAAIVLRDPQDAETRDRVAELLQTLAADPGNGIAAILDAREIARRGGTPQAAFWVDMRPGFAVSASLAGPLVVAVSMRGAHGQAPTHPELASFFAIAARGIRRGASLGEIDMLSIAPTLARLMGAALPDAEGKLLSVLEAGATH